MDAELRWRVSLREPARGERPLGSRRMNEVVTMWMMVRLGHPMIVVRGKRMMVQEHVQLAMRRTQRDMMGAVRHRHERPRDPARAPHREQENRYERLEAAHGALDTLPLDGGQTRLLTEPRRGTKRPTRVA